MVNYLNTLRRALEDPKLEGLSSLSNRMFGLVPQNCYVSEWRVGMGEIRYEYRVHRSEIGEELKRAFLEGNSGGHPKLTGVYSKEDLRRLNQPQEARSEYL